MIFPSSSSSSSSCLLPLLVLLAAPVLAHAAAAAAAAAAKNPWPSHYDQGAAASSTSTPNPAKTETRTGAKAQITVQDITGDTDPYISDPFVVPDGNDPKNVRISGTTQKFLTCADSLRPGCGQAHAISFDNGTLAQDAAKNGARICSPAGVHPLQDGNAWHAIVTLHVQTANSTCDGITGWSVIVHASPRGNASTDGLPTEWVGDTLLIGSWTDNVDANYDGKYFQTPAGELHVVYQKLISSPPWHRVGIAAWPMDSPTALKAGSQSALLLQPGDDFNSENYVAGNPDFKLVETANVLAHNGKFVMAYSAGAFAHNTYKVGIAYADAFEGPWRKVLKDNPEHLWKSNGTQEVYYLLQSEVKSEDWHHVADQVKAPGVPTVAQIGPDDGWVVTFAGYAPDEESNKGKYNPAHRRPLFVSVDVNVPQGGSVQAANATDLQTWIVPH